MDNEHFPHKMVLQELYWRDLYFFNYHVNHDKMAWFYESFEPAAAHRHEDHFSFWDPDHYQVITTEESGMASEAITPYIGSGVLVVANGLADDDSDEIVTQCTWPYVPTIPLFFEIRCKLSDALECEAYAGFMDAVGLFAGKPSDGFWFYKPDGYPDILFQVSHNGTPTSYTTGLHAADYTWIRLCAHYDGAQTIRWFIVDDATGLILYCGTHTIVAHTDLFYFAFGIKNGEPESQALFVDYIKVAGKLYTGIGFEDGPR